MNRYERYKDSGIPWLEEVPEHWEVKRLKFLTNKIVDGAHFTPTYVNEGVPFLRVTDIQEKNIDMEKIKYIPLEEHQELIKRCNPQKGDLLLSKNGTIGISKKIDWNWEFSIFVSLCLIKFNSLISSNYAKYFFDSNSLQEQIFGLIKKNTVINLHLDKIENFWFVLPSLKEQTAIAHYLDTKLGEIDALIDKQQTLLEKLAEQRTAVITHAVTKGLNPAAPMKKSGVEWLGDVPAHWDVSPFKLVMNSIIDYRGKTPEKTNSGVFLITARNIKNGIIDYTLSQEFIDEDNYEEVMRRGLPKLGQVLMTTEAPLGEVAQIDRTDVALAQRILKFDGKKDKLDNRFLKYFILSKAFQASLYKFATGSTALGIKSERLSYLKSLLPPVTEQTNIANYLDQETVKIDRLCETVNQTIGRLKEYRTALITQAVTGKIKVTNE